MSEALLFAAWLAAAPAAAQKPAATALTERQQLDLAEAALRARRHAYAPISGYHVGAAVLTPAGAFTGCNVENPSRRLTAHAEQVAAWKAAASGAREIWAVATIGAPAKTREAPEMRERWAQALRGAPGKAVSGPCGLCRQTLVEFDPAGRSMQTLDVGLDGSLTRSTLKDLFPASFGPRDLGIKPGPSRSGFPVVASMRLAKEAPRFHAGLQGELFSAAAGLLDRAYTPYPSNDPSQNELPRAAAVLTASGKAYLGVSVQNAAYTPAVRAEEAALFNAYCDGERDIRAVAVAGPASADAVPLDTLQILGALAPRAILLRPGQDGKVRADAVSDLAR